MAEALPGGARRMTSSSPKVATPSAIHWPVPVRSLVENCRMLMSNIACASQAPSMAPSNWTIT